jgi:DNA-binding PadR family transcriptional regulator
MVGGRRRRSYELTSAGRAALGEQRSAWREFAATVNALMDGGACPAVT